MQKGFRLVGQTKANKWSFREIKDLWEYTPGSIKSKGAKWMTDSSPNADMLVRKGDDFARALKKAGMTMTLAVPEIQMRAAPYKEKDYIETYRIYWYSTDSKGHEDYWRVIVFHHVTVEKVILKEKNTVPGQSGNASYYEVQLKIAADVEYFDKYGSAQ